MTKRKRIGWILGTVTLAGILLAVLLVVSSGSALAQTSDTNCIVAAGGVGGCTANDFGITDIDLLSTSMELLGARYKGVRVTLSFPDRPGQLARLTTTIANVGGNLVAAGAWPTEDPAIWRVMIKVTNLPKDQVVGVLDELKDVQVLDVRER